MSEYDEVPNAFEADDMVMAGDGHTTGRYDYGRAIDSVNDDLDRIEANRFADVDTVRELIGQAIGAGSTCWIGGTGSAEFDSTRASAIVDEAIERLEAISEHGDTAKPQEFAHTIDLGVTLALKDESGDEAVKVTVAYDNPRAAVAALHRVGSDAYLLQVAEMIGGLPEGVELLHEGDDD